MKLKLPNGFFRVETVVEKGKVCLEIEQDCNGQNILFSVDTIGTIDSIIEELTLAKAKIQEKNRVRKHGNV